MVKKAIQITVFGKVQHVGFRYSAQKVALDLGLTGFVKNLPDGSVFIEVGGDSENLEKFENWCLKGPGLARVLSVKSEAIEYKETDTFSIKVW